MSFLAGKHDDEIDALGLLLGRITPERSRRSSSKSARDGLRLGLRGRGDRLRRLVADDLIDDEERAMLSLDV